MVVEEEKEEKEEKEKKGGGGGGERETKKKGTKVQRYKPDLEFDTGDRRHKGDQVDE